MNIKWSRLAKSNLREIFDYYNDTASKTVALTIKRKIMQRVLDIKMFPTVGTMEPLLSHHKNEYRYIIEGHYKIIYTIHNHFIVIMTVFDTRRNPKKLKVRT